MKIKSECVDRGYCEYVYVYRYSLYFKSFVLVLDTCVVALKLIACTIDESARLEILPIVISSDRLQMRAGCYMAFMQIQYIRRHKV